jgi:hypothetical protein
MIKKYQNRKNRLFDQDHSYL